VVKLFKLTFDVQGFSLNIHMQRRQSEKRAYVCVAGGDQGKCGKARGPGSSFMKAEWGIYSHCPFHHALRLLQQGKEGAAVLRHVLRLYAKFQSIITTKMEISIGVIP
jgi:hypothetical protein